MCGDPGLRERVRELEAPLNAVHSRIGFASKIGETRNIHTDLISTGLLRKSKMQSAAGILKTELIDRGRIDNGVVLKSHVQVAD